MSNHDFSAYVAKIKVIGCGGGGCNAINRMIEKGIRGVDFISINTDVQALEASLAETRIQIGPKLTRGLGAGGDPEVGRKAADESRELIATALDDTDMLFITCGMGGGTGTGSSQVVGEVAREAGILTIGIVTRPFSFEGSVRNNKAEGGIDSLIPFVDTLITIPNDRLLGICDNRVTVDDAFMTADEILYNGVQSISELITVPGLINLDFADVRTIMTGAGQAWMAIGKGTGANRAIDAAKQALSSPLLDISIEGATGVLLNVTGSKNLALAEVHQAAELVKQAVSPDAHIIFGVAHDSSMNDDVRITLIATGFSTSLAKQSKVNQQEMMSTLTSVMQDEDTLDTPAFLRQRQQMSRPKQALNVPQEIRATKQPAKQPEKAASRRPISFLR